jgi:hypothetical protein
MKTNRTIIVIFLSVFLIGLGCSFWYIREISTKEVHYQFNSELNHYAESNNYIFYADIQDVKDPFSMLNIKNGKEQSLVKDLYKQDYSISNVLFSEGDYIYYMMFSQDYSERGLYEAYDKFRIVRLNTKDFTDTLVYEDNANGIKKKFLGLQNIEDDSARFYMSITGFFLDEKSIYFITQNQIWKVSRRTGKKDKIISVASMKSVAFDGTNIYYINDSLQIVKYNVSASKSAIVSDIATEFFVISDSKIYYINRRDNSCIYSYDLIRHKNQSLHSRAATFIAYDKKTIYYIDKDNSYLHQMSESGTQDSVVLKDAIIDFYVFPNYDEIFLSLISKQNQLIKVHKLRN